MLFCAVIWTMFILEWICQIEEDLQVCLLIPTFI